MFARQVFQYDKGLILQFPYELPLPETFEVHWSTNPNTPASVHIGTPEGVQIPEEYINTSTQVYGWVYIPNIDGSAVTVYNIVVPVVQRSEPSDYEPTSEEQTVIDEAIAALNNAVEVTTQNVEDSTAAKEAAELAQQSSETAQNLAELAQAAAETAQSSSEEFATISESFSQSSS